MRTFARLAPLAAFALLLDCRSLSAIPSDTCGNAVVDPGEDCDTFASAPGTSCRAPGTPGQCRLDCTKGSGDACPSGWGCGTDGICRQPSGSFSRASAPVAADAWRLMTGDFDGDGRADVLARAAIDVGGYSKVRIHYYAPQPDHTIALASTLVVPPTIASPTLADFDGDGLTDLAFVDGGIDVMLGQADRTLSPVAFPQYTLRQTSVTMALLHEYGTQPKNQMAFFAKSGGQSVIWVAQSAGQATVAVPAGKGPQDVAGQMITALFVDDPTQRACDSIALAYAGGDGADVYQPCHLVNGKAQLGLSAPTHVALPTGIAVDAGVRAGDVDGDGHVDLLIGAAAVAYVAYGDGQGNFHDADGNPDQASLLKITIGTSNVTTIRLPLAAGDLDGDGRADLVTPNAIFMSVPQASNYVVAAAKTPGVWTDAQIAEMTGDGLPDVVATTSGELDADFYVGTGTAALNPFPIATTGAVSHLSVGDLDGDRVNDVVLTQVAADPSVPDEITVAWGQAFAPPLPPVGVGQFPKVDQIVAAPLTTLPTRSDLAVLAHPANDATTALISVLLGSGDRQPLAPYVLTAAGQPQAQPIAITAGPFVAPGHVDVVAMGADVDSSNAITGFRYWLAPGTGAAAFGPPVSTTTLPPDFKPVYGGTSDVPSRAAMLMGWGDLGASRSPVVVGVAVDGTSETNGGFLPAHATAGKSPSLVVGSVQPIDARISPEGQLELDQDVDGDGFLDAVLLTGRNADAQRQIVVAWNDGAGQFAPTRSLTVNAPNEDPQGFAFVTVDASGRPRLAYVTRKTVVLATIDGTSRTVSARETIDTPTSATGIAAGDVDGDGVQDLALADQGNVIILRDAPVLE